MITSPLHFRIFNRRFKSFLQSTIYIAPIIIVVLILADSWKKFGVAMLHYLVVAIVLRIVPLASRIGFSTLSLSLDALLKNAFFFGCLIAIAEFLAPVLSIWFGWFSTVAILLFWLLPIIWLGHNKKKEYDNLLSKASTKNPLDPNGAWIIAVSRRFNLNEVDKLYYNQVLPVLNNYGIVLECLYADNSSNSEDYWATRMGLILELADIHILMEHFPSVAILHEQEYSKALQESKMSNMFLSKLLLGMEVDEVEHIQRYVPTPFSIHLMPGRKFPPDITKLYLPPRGINKRFTSALTYALDTSTKSLNFLYSQMEFPESILKSIHGSYHQRRQLASLMQKEETSRNVILDLIQKVKETNESEGTGLRSLWQSENKYHQFLLQIRANEKVIPKNYAESFELIRRLILENKLDAVGIEFSEGDGIGDVNDFDDIDELLLNTEKAYKRFFNMALQPYVFWLRIVGRKSIMK